MVFAPGKAFRIGVTIAPTKSLTSLAKAAPITNATARSMMLPRRTKSLKPLIMRVVPFWCDVVK